MSDSTPYSVVAADSGRGALQDHALAYRALLRLYPRWFRREFRTDLLLHLMRQRLEARYHGVLGAMRFWLHALLDTLRVSLGLRMERLRERSEVHLDGARGTGTGSSAGAPPPRRGLIAALADTVRTDVRDALRGVVRNPGYALVFVLTLGLGIGANTAMFSAVNGVLLRPLPHDDGDRLVYLRHSASLAGLENVLFSVPEIDDYRQASDALAAVAEFSAMDFTMLGYDTPKRVRAGIVTGNYFDVMGLGVARGRTIGPEDDGEAAPAVIVLSDAYWRQVFGADPGVLGTTVEMNGRTATFVGIAEPAPPYPERTDIYVNMATSPHHLDATMNEDRIHRMTEVFARLAPGATPESARAEIDTISARIHAEHAESYDRLAGYEVSVTPLKTQLTSRARPTLLLLLGTAFLVLTIACANLANLTLARAIRRDHELSIRVSLGSSRFALRRSLLTESLLLALVGAAFGLFIASIGLDLLVGFAARFTSRAAEISLDGTVFGVALLAAVAASMFFALIPRLPDGDRTGATLTSSGARSTAGPGARRAQRALVVAQIGASFVLLIGAGLMLRTMQHLQSLDPGFDTEQVLTMDIPIEFRGQPEAPVRNQYLAILEEVGQLPGVVGAALTSDVPFADGSQFVSLMEMKVDGHEPAQGAPHPRADFRVVTPGFFETLGIELVRGRDFVSTDLVDSQPVVIVNEALARAYFGDRNPIGERIAWTDQVFRFLGLGSEWRTIVGVAADTRAGGLDAAVPHAIYNPYRQVTPFMTSSLALRVAGDPAAVVGATRDVILSHDPNQPIVNVATLAELGTESVAPRRLNAMLLGSFAGLALVIAAVGIGGVLAFSVGARTHEFGVRSALGARQRQIWSGVLVEGARLAAFGIGIGSIGAFFLARSMAGLLVGVPALDPLTFAGVAILLATVAVLAAWAPAARAARISPIEAIRAE